MDPDCLENPKSHDRAGNVADMLRQATRAARAQNAIPRNEDGAPAPLSRGQEGLWLAGRSAPGSPLYNLPSAFRLRGPLQADVLRQALERVVRRHEALRLRIGLVEGTPRQAPEGPGGIPFAVVDLRHLPLEAREPEARQRVDEECRIPIDLARPPLLRSLLIRLAAEDHVWLLNVHHIVSDGWSMEILYREVSACYRALLVDAPATLPALPIRYTDWAAWQRRQADEGSLATHLGWWRQQLSGAPPLLELPADHPRPSQQSYRGETVRVLVPAPISARLRDLARHEGATLYATLLSAFLVLLHRWTGREDVVVGSPAAGRSHLETQDLIGYFVNVLALRVDLSGSPSFREVVRRVRQASLEARAHEDIPFADVVKALAPTRTGGYHGIFQVVFTLNQESSRTLDLPDIEAEKWSAGSGTSKFDLTFEMADCEGHLEGLLEYATDLFERATIERLGRHFVHLLEVALADPDQPVHALELLSPGERREILVDFNPGDRRPFPDRLLHQLFDEQAERTPEAVAVSGGTRQLTYAQLRAASEAVAALLTDLGVGPETCVGICVERSVTSLVYMLGVLRAGGAYVYLDPSYPPERLLFMHEDAAIPLVMVDPRTPPPVSFPRVAALATEAPTPSAPPARARAGRVLPDHLAYVTYTSGSAGRPKGVATPHRAVASYLEAMRREAWLTPDDILLSVSSLAFDFHILETWLPLVVGAQVVMADRATLTDGRKLRAELEERGVTAMGATPSTFRLLFEAGWAGGRHMKVHCGGEAFPPELARKLLDCTGGLWNVYGPTETTVYATTHRVRHVSSPVPVGRPLSNTRVYVVDAHGQLLPPGCPGELLIGGLGVARGYLRRPELTEQVFIENPFAREEQALGLDPPPRLYRSGDLARFLPNGRLEVLGRIDGQVKIRGFRIELEEIETVLSRHPSVRHAVVMAREDGSGDRRLLAYVVPQAGEEVTAGALRAHLARSLPEHMLPAAFVSIDAIPLTSTGKVDRKALPEPEHAACEAEYVAPRNSTEQALATLWCDLLDRPRVGVHDNFFDLGGHSMLAMRMFTRIERDFGKDLPLATLFTAPTVAELAEVLDGAQTVVNRTTLVPIQPRGRRAPLFWLHTLGGGGGGGLLRYRDLAIHLGPDQPSYGIEACRDPIPRIEDMATHYIETLKAFQPAGPYYLGGYCFGAVVAFEMARQLRERGEDIGLLALLEAQAPEPPSRSAGGVPARVMQRLQQFLERPTREQVIVLKRRMGRLARMLDPRQRGQGDVLPLSDFIDVSEYPQGFLHYAEVHWAALQRYRALHYPGRVDLFVVQTATSDPTFGWGELADEVEVELVPGTHESLLEEPHVHHLAELLRSRLDLASG